MTAPPEQMLAKLKAFAEAEHARIDSVTADHIALRLQSGMNPLIAYRLYARVDGSAVDAVLENTDDPMHSTDIFAVWMTAHHFLSALEKAFAATH